METERLRSIHQKLAELSGREGEDTQYADIASEIEEFLNGVVDESKKEQKDLSELALNCWRLTNWVNSSNAERKSVANSAVKKINGFLEKRDIALIDLTGKKYDDGYAADVMGIESDRDVSEDELIVSEMVKPIIMYKGSVVRHGQVILGDEVKAITDDNGGSLPEEPEKGIAIIQKNIDGYCNSKYKEKGIARKLRWCKEKLEKWLNNRRKEK